MSETLRAHLAHLREKAKAVVESYDSYSKHAADCHCAYCELRHAIAVTGGPCK